MTPRGRERLILPALAAAFAAAEAGLYLVLTRPRFLRWGATKEEQTRPLPGDELSEPELSHTQAITIDAPPERVWPWLIQMGQGRGGFYTHEWLEQAAGARIHNAETIVPEWQDVRVGDHVRTYWDVPGMEPLAWHIHTLEPNRALVLDWRGEGRSGWAFYLQPLPGGRTRLLARDHGVRVPRWRQPFRMLVTEPIHLYQTTGTLQGLKQRAERREPGEPPDEPPGDAPDRP